VVDQEDVETLVAGRLGLGGEVFIGAARMKHIRRHQQHHV
jgi:hypothetical protein